MGKVTLWGQGAMEDNPGAEKKTETFENEKLKLKEYEQLEGQRLKLRCIIRRSQSRGSPREKVLLERACRGV